MKILYWLALACFTTIKIQLALSPTESRSSMQCSVPGILHNVTTGLVSPATGLKWRHRPPQCHWINKWNCMGSSVKWDLPLVCHNVEVSELLSGVRLLSLLARAGCDDVEAQELCWRAGESKCGCDLCGWDPFTESQTGCGWQGPLEATSSNVPCSSRAT